MFLIFILILLHVSLKTQFLVVNQKKLKFMSFHISLLYDAYLSFLSSSEWIGPLGETIFVSTNPQLLSQVDTKIQSFAKALFSLICILCKYSNELTVILSFLASYDCITSDEEGIEERTEPHCLQIGIFAWKKSWNMLWCLWIFCLIWEIKFLPPWFSYLLNIMMCCYLTVCLLSNIYIFFFDR